VEQERAQWRMRADVARRSDPADIRAYASKLKWELIPAGESTLLATTPAEGALGEQVVTKVVSSKAAPKVVAAKKTRGSKSPTTGKAKAGTRER
jgi:hypothetical protein